jgi:hypothetical protein
MADDKIVILSHPWKGLGDSLQFSTLPELYSKLGYKVYISSKIQYQNSQVFDLVWKLNPYIEGVSDMEPNIGACKGFHSNLSSDFITNIELNHGLTNGYRKYPVVYYTPKLIPELSNTLLYDSTSYSGREGHTDDVINPSFKSIFAKYPEASIKKIEYESNVQNRDLPYFQHNKYIIKSIYDLCDAIYSCKVFLCLFSGGSVLASTLKQDNPTPQIYTFHASNYNNYTGYKFDNIHHLEFLQPYMCDVSLLKTYMFEKKQRLGKLGDGGYVIATLDGEYDCYISAGVSNEESFSRDFIQAFGMKKDNSFAFDGTIHDYPYNYTQDITFIKKNINSFNDDSNTNLYDITSKYDNIFLKMDIEGGEYPWLLSCDDATMKRYKQIVIECHALVNASGPGTIPELNSISYNTKNNFFAKLASTHYLVHAHGNNCGPRVDGIPYTIELTYINKMYFQHEPTANTVPFPIQGIDYSNNPDSTCPDYSLNFQPFVF